MSPSPFRNLRPGTDTVGRIALDLICNAFGVLGVCALCIACGAGH